MLNLTTKQALEIYKSQFALAREVMESAEHGNADSFKNIAFMFLGKLGVKPGRKKYYVDKSNKKVP